MVYSNADFVVDEANAGRRLDSLVRKLCDNVPLGTLMKWLRMGRVRLNNRRSQPSVRVALGDVVGLPQAVMAFGAAPHNAAAAAATTASPSSAPRLPKARRLPPLNIVFEDAHLLIVDKPAMLAVHPGTKLGDDCLTARVNQYLDAGHAPVGHKPGLSQRLDRGVSGLLPIGKDARVLRSLSEQGARRTMDKTYVALVDGLVAQDAGVIDAPLKVGDEPMGNRPRVRVAPAGQPAHTMYRVLRRFADCTLVAVRLRTGRTHQIRAHMLHLGHGLLGDPRYGDLYRNRYLFETLGLRRPFLHAARLTLEHPVSGGALRFEAALPQDLLRVLMFVLGKQERCMAPEAQLAWLAHPLGQA